MSHSALFKLLKPEPVRTTQVYMMFYVSARFPLSQYDWIKSLVLGYGLSNTKIFAFLKHFFFFTDDQCEVTWKSLRQAHPSGLQAFRTTPDEQRASQRTFAPVAKTFKPEA